MTNSVGIIEQLTGRMRPRHRRFHRAFEQLSAKLGLQPYRLSQPTLRQRLAMQAEMRLRGYRSLRLDEPGTVALLHQALNRGTTPYLAEFDVPLALHGYDIRRHQRAAAAARSLMEQPQLRSLLTFSDWARRSFELHFGPAVGAKCRTVYPLAFEEAHCGSFDQRTYDFAFISISFRTKCCPETVRAFCRARALAGGGARMCVVTRLAQARQQLGDLERYEGVDWREATLTESEIAALLADARCLLHPSLNDSFGVVVLEALAAGCAVVATDIASFPEMVSHEGNGWILHAPTAAVVGETFITELGTVAYHEAYLNTLSLHRLEEALGEVMLRFLSDPQRARAMMMASHVLYQERFSLAAWERGMTRVLADSFPELGLSG
ncbi:MAG: glycosyltransferase family 4 protein [Nevskiales bacterium]